MELNMRKTQLYCPAPPDSDSWRLAMAEVRSLGIGFAKDGITVCGSPVGSEAFEQKSASETVD
jgi:hypothetical protein